MTLHHPQASWKPLVCLSCFEPRGCVLLMVPLDLIVSPDQPSITAHIGSHCFLLPFPHATIFQLSCSLLRYHRYIKLCILHLHGSVCPLCYLITAQFCTQNYFMFVDLHTARLGQLLTNIRTNSHARQSMNKEPLTFYCISRIRHHENKDSIGARATGRSAAAVDCPRPRPR